MPYQLFQGGRMRRHKRRPWPLLGVVALAAAAVVVALGLRDHGGRRGGVERGAAAVTPSPAPLQSSPTPLAGGGPAPSPPAGRLEDPRDVVRVRFKHPPRSGLLFDVDTGRVLWRRDPTRVLPIASLTKMMTALVVNDRIARGSRVLVTKQALAYTGSGVGVLPKGRWIDVQTMLYGLLLPSGNDAAIALAQRAAGTVQGFVRLMNARASAMGLECTHFTTPSGIQDRGNHSCASDLAALSRALLRRPRLARIVRTRAVVRHFPIKGHKLFLYNNNPLLVRGYRGTTGLKTGYTVAAGQCLVATARRGAIDLGVVLLHSPNTGDQARRLLDRGFRAERAAA